VAPLPLGGGMYPGFARAAVEFELFELMFPSSREVFRSQDWLTDRKDLFKLEKLRSKELSACSKFLCEDNALFLLL